MGLIRKLIAWFAIIMIVAIGWTVIDAALELHAPTWFSILIGMLAGFGAIAWLEIDFR